MLNESLIKYLKHENSISKFKASLGVRGGIVTFYNTSNKGYSLSIDSLILSFKDIANQIGEFQKHLNYNETEWRQLGVNYFTDEVAGPMLGVQTKPLFSLLSKLIKWANALEFDSVDSDSYIEIDTQTIFNTIESLELLAQIYEPVKRKSPISFRDVPENILFYGPPGTGKTREIQVNYLDGKTEEEKEFVTFHQSYSYEEFIEGIKPNIGMSEKVLLTITHLRDFCHAVFKYVLESGSWEKILSKSEQSESRIENLEYTGIRINEYFGSNNLIGHFDIAQNKSTLTSSSTQRFFEDDLGIPGKPHSYFTTQWVEKGKKSLSFASLQNFINDISNGELKAVHHDDNYILIQQLSISAGITYEFSDGVFYRSCKKAAILAGYSSLEDCASDTTEGRSEKFKKAMDEGKIFTFCIDELNRANVASVFGELITLIETDKRLGAENELIVKLPYSKRSFGVPSNLQLIGSMNTADRSITLLDSALRRRFKFVEIGPDPSILSSIHIDSIELDKILTIINKRISYFLGKDLCLGHAYFLSGLSKDKPTKLELLNIFLNKIIPLLEEYFYNDLKKVRLILGDDRKDDDNLKFYIKDKLSDVSELFRRFEENYEEKDTFVLNPSILSLNEEEKISIELFTKIYS